MTVSTTKNRINQLADGIQTVFPYDFIVQEESQMYPYFDNVVQTTGFTVNGVGDELGGDVTFAVAPTSGVTVTLQRIVDETQVVDYLPYDPFPAETHEGALDKLTLISQQLADEVGRAIKADVSTPEDTDYTLPLPDAGKGLLWNATEDGLENTTDNLNDIVSDATTQADASAASASAAAGSAASAAADVVLTNADVVQTAADRVQTGLDVIAADLSASDAELAAASAATVTGRNKVQNQAPLSQGESTRSGMSSTIYTGNGATQSINNGLDMNTGDFGGLVWGKSRGLGQSHWLADTVRGANKNLASDSTAIEGTAVNVVTAFTSTGFNIGDAVRVNSNTDTLVSWNFQTTKKTTGLTNRNKAYTCHYNPDMNFSIVGYLGDGVDGHEIPHHLGVVPELTIIKNRDSVVDWIVKSPLFNSDEYLFLNSTIALAVGATTDALFSNTAIQLDTYSGFNESTKNHIAYNFASKSGICKIIRYTGNGAAGKQISTEVDGGDAFKPSFVKYKNLTVADGWIDVDSIRGDNYLQSNSSAAEAALDIFDFTDNGLVTKGANGNALNQEYIAIIFAETSIDATKAVADYPYATNPDTLTIEENTLISLANGFNANGQVDTQYQFPASQTEVYGVGHEDKHYYLYTDKLGVRGVSETRPLSGITRNDADKYGEVSPSDKTLRTTSKHFDYESDSGVALASGESVDSVWKAFDAPENNITSAWSDAVTGASWVQYKHSEKRILKSWRMQESSTAARTPDNFNIEGSNDGLNWTVIDSTYNTTNFNTVTNGARLWSPLQDTSANTTAYLYHRINIINNNGDVTYTEIAELEFNTILATDYYLIEEAKMYNSSDAAIERMYLGEFRTDADGDVIKDSIINYAIAEQEVGSLVVHEKLVVLGEIINENSITAKGIYGGAVNPPLLHDSFNVADIVDLGAGIVKVIFKEEMDSNKYIVVGGSDYHGLLDIEVQTTKSFNITNINSTTATGVDPNLAWFVVIGGKKIL